MAVMRIADIGDLGEVVGINVPFSIPLVDADGAVLDRPPIGSFRIVPVRSRETRPCPACGCTGLRPR